MRSYYDTIYLSPHLDDAALSCGGQIFAQTAGGRTVLVVTVMAGDPPGGSLTEFAGILHGRWQLAADAVAARRQEDVAACCVLGADHAHWDTPDCIYRRQPDTGEAMYLSNSDIFGAVHTTEAGLIDLLARRIDDLPGHDRLLVPLTAGHHVDHQLMRLAAERSRDADRLYYYEDYPYVQAPGALAAAMDAPEKEWRFEIIPLAEADLAARMDAVAAFVSQLSSFFNGRADLERQIRGYVQQVGGERLWYQGADD